MKKQISFQNILLALIALILLFLPTYLIRFKIFNIPMTFLEIYVYFVFILFLIEKLTNKEKIFSKKFILPVLLVIIALISSYFAVEKMAALGQWKAYFFDGFLAFTMLYSFRDNLGFRKKSFIFYLISGLIVSIWGLLQRVGVVGLISHQLTDPLLSSQINQGRILGPFESPNYLAMFIAPLIIILIISYFRNSEFNYLKKYAWPLLIIFTLTLFLTQSVSAILAVIITLTLYFILNSKNKLKWLYTILLLLFLVFGVFYLSKYSSKSGSIAARKEIYHAAVRIGETHQIFGIGMGNFPKYFIELPITNRLNYEALHPHNVFLAFWVYMGWPGLILFLALISFCLRRENYHQNKIYYFVLLVVLINGLTDTTIFKNDLSIIFWYLVTLLI